MSCASTSAHFTSLKLRTLLPTPAIHSRFEEIPPFQRDSTSNYLARPIPADFRIRTTRILREISRGRRRWKPGFFQTKRRVARISTRIFAREKPITNGSRILRPRFRTSRSCACLSQRCIREVRPFLSFLRTSNSSTPRQSCVELSIWRKVEGCTTSLLRGIVI